MRSWGLHRVTTVLLAIVLPIGVIATFVKDDDDTADTAGTDGGGGEAVESVGSFSEAADRTAAVDHLRYEVTMELDGGPLDIDPVVIGHGEQAGTRYHSVTDPGALAESFGTEGLGDQVVETFSDGVTTYMRAPGYAALAQQAVPLPPEFQALVDLGDRWGIIDETRVAVLDVAGELGGGGLNITTGLDLIRKTVGETEEAGTSEVHGVPVDLYEGAITFAEMVGTSGLDPETFEAIVGGSVGGGDAGLIIEAMNDAELTVQLGIDGDGLVRRIAYELGQEFFDAVFEGLGEEPEDLGFSMTSAVELYDLGDQSITVELPVVEDPVDLTPWALELFGAQTD